MLLLCSTCGMTVVTGAGPTLSVVRLLSPGIELSSSEWKPLSESGPLGIRLKMVVRNPLSMLGRLMMSCESLSVLCATAMILCSAIMLGLFSLQARLTAVWLVSVCLKVV